jgi:hypothetical protein
LRQADAVTLDDAGAPISALHEVEGVAIIDHAILDWCRRCDAIGWRGLHCGRRGAASDDRDAHVDIGPKSFAAGTDLGVPCVELKEADGISLCNCSAVLVRLNQVESITVVEYARLYG